jgi:RND superfamily putative drug exporter
VLYDTFVVRMLVVPALMAMIGDLSWWPGRMPPPKQSDGE